MTKTRQHPRFENFLYRPDAYDDYIVREQGSYGRLGIEPGESALDIGAQIGAFARWAWEQGAGKVTCVEPEPDNLELLRRNTEGFDVRILAGAAIGRDDTQVDLFVNEKKNQGLHSTEHVRGRAAIRVPAFRFSRLLGRYRPRVLKVDIEGAEYNLDWITALHEKWKPRMIAVELHLQGTARRSKLAPQLMETIRLAGYHQLTPREVPPTSWTTLAFFQRRD